MPLMSMLGPLIVGSLHICVFTGGVMVGQEGKSWNYLFSVVSVAPLIGPRAWDC